MAGIGLGIIATIDKPNATGEFVLDGSPLHGDSLSNHAFLVASGANVPKLSGVVNLVAADIDASAKLNLIPVSLGNGASASPAGSGTSHQTYSTTLKDPNNDGRLTFTELKNGLANVRTITNPAVIGGASNFSLPASGTLPWGTVASNPGVTITWTDLANPNTISIDYGPQLAQLRDFGAVDKNAIAVLMDQVAMYLARIEAVSFLRDNIPLLDKNLGSLVNAAEKFRNAMNDFGDDVIDSLVSLEERLESAVEKVLGIPVTPGDGPTVELMPDNTPGRRALRVEIDYNPTYTKQHNLNLDLDALGVPAIGNLVDARGSAMFSVTAGANVNLDVGLDLTNPANPRPFLYNTTTAALGAKIYGSGIHFKAALGPLGIAIGNGGNNNGFLVLDSDGLLEPNANSNDRAGLTVGITGGDANGRVYFESLTPSNLSTPAVDGQMNLRLPVYKTDKTTVLDAANPNLAWQFQLNNLSLPPAPTAVPNFAAAFDALRLDGALDGFRDGWDSVFQVLDVALDNSAFLAQIPLIGDQLKDAASFVKDLRDRVVNNFDQAGNLTTEVLRQKIYEAVGPGGLNWLQDRNGNGVQIDDVVLSPGIINSATSEIRVDITLAQSATLVDLPLDFDLGLPLIGLELDGGIQLKAGFSWNFGFGISKTQGFFLSTAANDELKFTIDATIPNFAAKGSLGFFQVDATDDPTAPSHLTGQIVVNLIDPSSDGRLTLGELSSLSSFTQIVDARFSGFADINLKLRASFGGSADFPNINADFNLDWNFLNSSTSASAFGGNSSPVLALNNVTIDAGQAISKFLGPILTTIDDILQPIEPILDFLNAPLPVVTDLLGSPVSLLTLAEVYSTVSNNEGLANAAKFIKLATQINDLANTASQTGSAAINLGSFKIAGGAGAIAGLDLRNTSLASLDEARISQIAGVLGNIPLLGDVLKFVNATEILAGAAGGLGGLDGNQGGFDFPIIKKPLLVLQALLGGKPEGIVFFTF